MARLRHIPLRRAKAGHLVAVRGDYGKRRARSHTFVPGRDRTGGYYGRFTRGGERKFHDVTIDDAALDTGGTIQASLLTIAEGNGEEQRIGRKITLKSVQWKVQLTLATTASAGNTADTYRLIMYQDKQTNGAAAAVLDILETAVFNSFYNLANEKRFRILCDKTGTINSTAGSGRGTTDTLSYAEKSMNLKFYKSLDMPIEYDNSATTGVITSIRSSGVGLLFISASGFIGLVSKLRFRYTDQ